MEYTNILGSVSEEDKKKILINPPFEFSFDERGVGWEFYKALQKYKNNIAQINIETGQKKTYGSLLLGSVRTAIEMRRRGITENDTITVCSDNNLDIIFPYIASFFLGCKASSLHPNLFPEDITSLIGKVKPKMVFITSNCIKLVEDALEKSNVNAEVVVFGDCENYTIFKVFLRPQIEENAFQPITKSLKDASIIYFSSGTTGLPKGICHSGYALLRAGQGLVEAGYDLSVCLAYYPIYWITAVFTFVGSLLSGGVRLVAKDYNVNQWWYWVDTYKISFLFMPPFLAINTIEAGRPSGVDTSSLKDVLIGGQKISSKFIKEFLQLLPETRVGACYGQTEISTCITTFKPIDVKMLLEKPDSCGRPWPGVHMKIVDSESGKILGPNQSGSLRIKSDLLMIGYWQEDCTHVFDGDGWLITGDVAYYDEDRCFFIVDREKELLKFRGTHIPPATLEILLSKHPAVKQVAIVGVPHESDGEHPKAIVVLKKGYEGTQDEEIIKYVEEHAMDFQRLRGGVKFVQSIPMTATGKINRKLLKTLV